MKVLITGHRGFVGSHFHKRLQDHDLTLIDIAEGNDASEFFRTNKDKYDLVIHLAATVGGRQAIDNQPWRLFNNFVLDAEMFQWALRTKPDHVVYYSSSACYPNHLQVKDSGIKLKESDIDLHDIRSPDPSIYGLSKLAGEGIAMYSQQQGLRVHIFRPFSGYSHLQSLDYPFPSFIHRAVNRDDPFAIWGDGEQVRDWIHIDDIVEATLAAVEQNIAGPINLCSGVPTNFNDLAKLVTSMVGYNPELHHILKAPVGVQYRVGDPTKLNSFYEIKIPLELGIEKALKAHEDRNNRV